MSWNVVGCLKLDSQDKLDLCKGTESRWFRKMLMRIRLSNECVWRLILGYLVSARWAHCTFFRPTFILQCQEYLSRRIQLPLQPRPGYYHLGHERLTLPFDFFRTQILVTMNSRIIDFKIAFLHIDKTWFRGINYKGMNNPVWEGDENEESKCF